MSSVPSVANQFMKKPKLVAIVGPTATGKTSLGLSLAVKFHGEIISADSVQVYRGLDIGTAKPTMDERRLVPHHLIDILDPDEEYSAALFRSHADRVIRRLDQERTPAFLAGGTGLYLKVLTRGLFHGPGGDPGLRSSLRQRAAAEGGEGLHRELETVDPAAAARIHPHDTFRVIRALEVCAQTQRPISQFQGEHGFRENPYSVLKIGLFCEREELYARIESRVEKMVERGWVEEVRSLLSRGYSPALRSMRSLGYRHIVSYLQGEIDFPRAVLWTKRDTRRYAKRQVTWFKSDPEIRWFPAEQDREGEVGSAVEEFLSQC